MPTQPSNEELSQQIHLSLSRAHNVLTMKKEGRFEDSRAIAQTLALEFLALRDQHNDETMTLTRDALLRMAIRLYLSAENPEQARALLSLFQNPNVEADAVKEIDSHYTNKKKKK